MKRLVFFLCFAFTLTHAVSPLYGKPKDDNWQDYAYISYHKQNPKEIIEEGNNFDVLLSLMSPQTLEELNASGLPYDMPQLKFLERKGFIKNGSDGLWRTAITIFDKEQTVQLREFSKSISGTICSNVRDDFKSFVGMLKENGWESNALFDMLLICA